MVREDVVASAVNFLKDPNVAAAGIDKRIAFLQSKNLTTEEINLALQRVGEPHVAGSNSVAPYIPPPPSIAPNPYGSGYLVTQSQQQNLPHRDWRDYFVIATVTTGVTYGLYHLAKRYVYPLISPPTPEQLSQDKASIDSQFATAFSLLDQLHSDTAALKSAEEERTKRVDTCLEEVERVVEQLKETAKRREDEGKRVGEEVRSLRDLIPKALEGQKEAQAQSLQELQNELKSLKSLVMNRTGAVRPSYLPTGPPPLDPGALSSTNGLPLPSSSASTPAPSTSIQLGGSGGQALGSGPSGMGGGMSAVGIARRDSGSPLPFGYSVKSSIPDWQKNLLKPQQTSSLSPPATAANEESGVEAGSSS